MDSYARGDPVVAVVVAIQVPLGRWPVQDDGFASTCGAMPLGISRFIVFKQELQEVRPARVAKRLHITYKGDLKIGYRDASHKKPSPRRTLQ